MANFQYPNGVKHTYAYNKLNRLTDLAVKDATSTTLVSYSYSLGPTGSRTSVTEVACRMQALGLISYARGTITVRDAEALKKLSCECYESLRIREMV